MFSTLLTVALFAAPAIRGVLGDFTVYTVPLTQCQDGTLTWDETTGPYNVYLVNASDPCGPELFNVGQFDTNSATFKVPLPENTRVQAYVENANDEGWSGFITIARSGDTSCILPDLIASAADSPAATGTQGSNTGALSTPTPPSTPQGPSDGNGGDSSVAPVGAANAGLLGGDSSAAPSSRHLSVSAVALGALTALVASTL